MNLQTETIHYQNALEAFRQHPWNDDLTEQLRQATYALEAAYLETIPMRNEESPSEPGPSDVKVCSHHVRTLYLILCFGAAATALLARHHRGKHRVESEA